MHGKALLVVVCLVAGAAGASWAQATARQGDSPSDVVEFDSPMILELPLPAQKLLVAGTQVHLANVRRYICDDDVSLLNLRLGKGREERGSAGELELVVTGAVLVADSHDRRVDIALRLKSGDEVLASETLRNYSVEEGATRPFRLVLPVQESMLDAAYAAQPKPMFELTLTVRSDA